MPRLLKTVLRASAIFAVAASVAPLLADALGDTVAGTPSAFITDRPNFTESATVAGRGNYHFEYGTTLAHEDGALRFAGPELLVRAGVNQRL